MARRTADNAIDWDAIERQYRLGAKSNKQLGTEFGASGSSIGRRATQRGWIHPQADVLPPRPVSMAALIQRTTSERGCAGFVYVVFVEPEGAQRLCKIGMSASLSERVKTLQTSSPYEIQVACCYFVPDMRNEERDLHEMFRGSHVRGEWFDLTSADLTRIASRALLT